MPTEPPDRARRDLAVLLPLGAAGGAAALLAGLPMPFLLGSLTVCGIFAVWSAQRTGRAVVFPRLLRSAFVALIGTMIGAAFSPALVGELPGLWLSLCAVVVFVVVAHGVGFVVYRRLGRYDRATAFYAAMPGGLIEAIEMGRAAGAAFDLLAVQHFARIILVVVTVPLLFWVWTGVAVGSAGGQTMERAGAGPWDMALAAGLALAGLAVGLRLRLPAAPLMGALLLSGGLHGAGVVSLALPAWLLHLAQLVVGAGLGAQFSGTAPRLLLRAFGLGALTMGLMLAIGAGFAGVLAAATGLDWPALFISFAPGGVTEMGLVALSLGVSPVIVAAHHLARIMLAVVLSAWFVKTVGLQ